MKQLRTIILKRNDNNEYSFEMIEYSPEIQRAKWERDILCQISENETILTIETDFNTGNLDRWESEALYKKIKNDIDGAKRTLIEHEASRIFALETNLNKLKQNLSK